MTTSVHGKVEGVAGHGQSWLISKCRTLFFALKVLNGMQHFPCFCSMFFHVFSVEPCVSKKAEMYDMLCCVEFEANSMPYNVSIG